jgi:hypothetical protein
MEHIKMEKYSINPSRRRFIRMIETFWKTEKVKE